MRRCSQPSDDLAIDHDPARDEPVAAYVLLFAKFDKLGEKLRMRGLPHLM